MVKDGKRLTKQKNPKLGNASLVSQKEDRELKKREKISFSFLHFRQIEHFGIGGCSRQWFTSLLERLSTLCDLSFHEIREEHGGSKSLRCHQIDWKQKNMPIRRTDLCWLPQVIRDNEDE